jgi:SAM-dependent methyltransferase
VLPLAVMSEESTILISGIRADIQIIEDDADIYHETHFNARAQALDFIEFHILDRIDGILTSVPNTEFDLLKQQAVKAKQRLEAIDTNLFKRLREQISSGACLQASFKAMIQSYCGVNYSKPGKIGYDDQDTFINGLLTGQPLPEANLTPKPEMVFYQQTPARIIFEMAERAKLTPNNVFFDIGSGLGQVPILINLLTGSKARGIEYEPAYCDYAAACAAALNLSEVAFINTQAQNGDYSEGAVFFMYTPFEGLMLKQMMNVLKKESLKRPIRIFTYGPCSPTIARQSWLRCVNGPADNIYMLYEFNSKV